MIRKVISLTFLLALTAVSVFAQKTDYSGTWKMNVAKSDFGASNSVITVGPRNP